MKITIIGGGAAGLMAASLLNRKKVNAEIILLEKLEHVGKKILVTGNGKCNLSNMKIEENCYNNQMAYEIASSYNVKEYFGKIGLLTYIGEEGRIYPFSNMANTVSDVLRASLTNVKVIENANVIKIAKEQNGYNILTSDGANYQSDYVIIATGGKTYYKDTNSYQLASFLGHKVTPLRPALTPIKIKENLASIENLRCKVKAYLGYGNDNIIYEDKGEVLFKKDHLSGIVMFQLSNAMANNPNHNFYVMLDMAPTLTEEFLTSFIEKHKDMNGMFSKMINQYILKNSPTNEPKDIAHTIKHLKFNVEESIDFKNAQITAGGIAMNEIKDTLESKYHPNLYFLGEILDVNGICGGYNLHFAFASAFKACEDIALKIGKDNEKDN